PPGGHRPRRSGGRPAVGRMTSTRPRLGGVAAAPGVARGPWAELASTLPAAGRVQASDVVRERERMQRAASQAATELRELATRLPRERLLGIALEGSSPTAHASILARAFGIPAVVGVAGLLDAVRSAGPGTEVAIDGSTGEVVVDPDEVERGRFERLSAGVRL